MISCSQCNTFVADEMAFCTNCGEPLEFATVIRPPITNASVELGNLPKDNAVLKVVGAVVGTVVFGAFLYFLGKGNAERQVIPIPVNQVVVITATPTPVPKTSGPTPQTANIRGSEIEIKPTPTAEISEQTRRSMANAERVMRNAMNADGSIRTNPNLSMPPYNAAIANKAANANISSRRYKAAKCSDGTVDNRPWESAHLLCSGHGWPVKWLNQ